MLITPKFVELSCQAQGLSHLLSCPSATRKWAWHKRRGVLATALGHALSLRCITRTAAHLLLLLRPAVSWGHHNVGMSLLICNQVHTSHPLRKGALLLEMRVGCRRRDAHVFTYPVVIFEVGRHHRAQGTLSTIYHHSASMRSHCHSYSYSPALSCSCDMQIRALALSSDLALGHVSYIMSVQRSAARCSLVPRLALIAHAQLTLACFHTAICTTCTCHA